MEYIKNNPSKETLDDGYDEFVYNFSKFLSGGYSYFFKHDDSKKYIDQFSEFMKKFRREGIIQTKLGKVKLNSIEEYKIDASIKGLTKINYVFSDEELESLEKEVLFNKEGQKISTIYLRNENSNKWVIGLHGWTENKYLALRQVYLFYKQGYNILTFDMQAHGESYGEITDIGLTTGKDIEAIVLWLQEKYNLESYGLIGNSMGASASMKFSQDYYEENSKLKFVIEDCGFANMLVQFRYIMQYRYGKNWWNISNNLSKELEKEFGVSFKEYNLLKKMNKISSLPVLFIHGTTDDFVPVFMAKEMYKEKIRFETTQKSELVLIPNIGHVLAVGKGNNIYQQSIIKFLEGINF